MNVTFTDFIELFTSSDLDNPVIISIFGFFGLVLILKAVCSLISSVTGVFK